jgi:hypothetical protein
MFMVEIDGMRLLYTGDYSRAADRHMPAADLPSPKPHIGAVFLFSINFMPYSAFVLRPTSPPALQQNELEGTLRPRIRSFCAHFALSCVVRRLPHMLSGGLRQGYGAQAASPHAEFI